MYRSLTRLSLLLSGLVVAAGSVAATQPVSAQDPGSLTGDLDAILGNPGLTGADVGLVVRAADTGEVLYRHGSDRRHNRAVKRRVGSRARSVSARQVTPRQRREVA